MDVWASLDHKLRYNKNIKNSDKIAEELRQCAEAISAIDYHMQRIRNRIETETEN